MGIDIIIGIDRLFKNNANIDCNKKYVYLDEDIASGKKLFFKWQQLKNHPLLISYAKATNYQQKECQWYLPN